MRDRTRSLVALVLLWPLGVATEFRPWVLWEPENRKVTADFVRSFWPLVHHAEFMEMVVRETWRTVAMATAGVTIQVRRTVPRPVREDMIPYSVDVVCIDQAGIVSGLSGFFAARGIQCLLREGWVVGQRSNVHRQGCQQRVVRMTEAKRRVQRHTGL